MKISVAAKPNATKNSVEEMEEGQLRVSVTEPPIRGRANTAILKLLAEYFGVPASRVTLLHGHTSRNKVVEITL